MIWSVTFIRISPETGKHCSLVYEPSATAEDFATRMEEARVKDLKMGMTSYGPHRDDISFLINET